MCLFANMIFININRFPVLQEPNVRSLNDRQIKVFTAFYSKLAKISVIGLWSPIGPNIFSWTSVMCQTPAHFIAAAHFTYPSLLMEWIRHLRRNVLYFHLHKQLIEHNSSFSTKKQRVHVKDITRVIKTTIVGNFILHFRLSIKT